MHQLKLGKNLDFELLRKFKNKIKTWQKDQNETYENVSIAGTKFFHQRKPGTNLMFSPKDKSVENQLSLT